MSISDSPPSVSATLDERVGRLERKFLHYVGSQPDLINNGKGTGLIQAVVDLGDRLDALAAVVQADIASRRAEAEARAARAAPWSKAAWIVLGSALGCLTTSGLGAFGYWLLHR